MGSAIASGPRENRRAERHRVLSHARIISGGVIANCIVRDPSETGARLGVSRKVKLPPQFDLLFARHGLELRTRISWRRGDFVGASFCLEERIARLVRQHSKKPFVPKA